MESFRFGQFELCPATRMLLAGSEPVPIGSRAFDLLCVLVQSADRVVSKSELMDRVWPGRVVEDNNLAVQVSTLRKLLGQSAIATVTTQGYRFTRLLHGPVVDSGAGMLAADALKPEVLQYGDAPVLLVVLADGDDAGSAATGGSAVATGSMLARWLPHAFDAATRRHGGVRVAHSGDGCVAGFASARAATAGALDLQAQARLLSGGDQAGLRVALVPHLDGASAAKAVQLARCAPAGQTLADAAVRDAVTDTVDCRIDDLGELRTRQDAHAVRAYRLQAPDIPAAPQAQWRDAAGMKPLIAVLPFESRQTGPATLAIGDLIADGLICVLSHARHTWRVISRLSASAMRGRTNPAQEAQQHLHATYVVSGSYVEQQHRLLITLQVVDSSSGEVVRALRLDGQVADLLNLQSELLDAMIREVQRAIQHVELRRVFSAPVPTLQSYTLLLGGIQLLHRSTQRDFDMSFKVLDQLAQWHPNALEPRVWQAKWYAMRAVQGLSTNLLADAKAALACTGAALAIDPDNAFALAMEGFVHTHLTHDYDAARERLALAIQQNDSETFAHLYNGVVQGVSGDYSGGLASYEVALSTSPHDPARYMMDSIGAYLYLACGRHDDAIRAAKESLRHNANHAHSWRIMTIAQQETGVPDEARRGVQRILQLQPDLTVARYLAGGRQGDAVRHRFAQALGLAGLPAG